MYLETEKVCSYAYLLKNNKVRQFVKLMISSMSSMHVRYLSRPDHDRTFQFQIIK